MYHIRHLLVIVLFLAVTIGVLAGPTIIHDNRVTDIASTPVLGRGYSISTNTFQSTCLQDVAITQPSYDFKYVFESVDASSLTSNKTEVYAKGDASYYFVKAHVEAHVKQSTVTKKQYKHMVASIDMSTYYASVDESKSKLSETAVQLLKKDDLIGFFSSCGAYYVRSILRNARFISIFTYESTDETSDKKFEASLQASVRSFVKADLSTSVTKEFHQESSKRNLLIVSRAYGLGKDSNASLISYDLDSFKAAITEAYKSMQNPLTGKVKAIEVVPWVENTEFQNLVDLHEEVKDKNDNVLLVYEKKLILNLNAEFIAEINRADRNMMNIYYKAKICKQFIEENWMQNNKFKDDYASAMVRNNRGGTPIKVTELYNKLNEGSGAGSFIEKLIQAERAFMYGADSKGGAAKCMRDIMGTGIYKSTYREIDSCKDIFQKMAALESDMIDNHCMPILEQ